MFLFIYLKKDKFTCENEENSRFRDTCSANILVSIVTNIFKGVFAADTFLKMSYGSDEIVKEV